MKTKIFMCADSHGSFKPFRDFWERNKAELEQYDKIVIIVLGDFGANFFFNHRDTELKKNLGRYPFEYFIIRGNHEERPNICAKKNPDLWEVERYFFGNTVYVEKEFPYIKYALDQPALYNINGLKTLIVPGAYSVDKYRRLQKGWSWFEQEMLSEREQDLGMEIVKKIKKVDLVLSHTCPICFEPTDLFLSCVDQSMVDKTMERYLGRIEYQLDYKVFCWGHYHAFRDYPRDNGIPSYDNPRRLMLYNQFFVDLEDVMNIEETLYGKEI